MLNPTNYLHALGFWIIQLQDMVNCKHLLSFSLILYHTDIKIYIWHDVHNELKLKMFRWHIKQWHWSSDINKLTGQARETLKSNLLDISTVMQHQFCSTCILLKIRINQSTTMQWNPMIIKQRADKSEIQQVTPRQSMLLMPYSVHIVPSLRVAEIKPRISTREDYRLYTNSLLLASCYKY